MLSKFSVKRPYTVVVGVVLIIILGVVSFGNMTLDLLPSMNLPYAIVMTTYTGASPEEVEEVVTKPVEQTMAAVSNIKTIQSISNENASTGHIGVRTDNEHGLRYHRDERKPGSDPGILAGCSFESHYYEIKSRYDACTDCCSQCRWR